MSTYKNGPGNVPRLPDRVVDTLIDSAGVSRCAPGRTANTVRDQTANVEQLVHDACEELLARLPAPVSAPAAVERESIDTDELWQLVQECHAGYQYGPVSRHERAKAALIAFIDTWAARSAGDAVQAREAARYRWLRDKSEPGICTFYLSVGQAFKNVKFAPETVDEAIDAQIGAAAPTPGNTAPVVQPEKVCRNCAGFDWEPSVSGERKPCGFCRDSANKGAKGGQA